MRPSNELLAEMLSDHVGPMLFRLAWWNSLDPKKRDDFAEDFFSVLTVAIMHSFEEHSGTKLPADVFPLVRPVFRTFLESRMGDFVSKIPEFWDETYPALIKRITTLRNESQFNSLIAEQYDLFTLRIANLSEDLISAVKLINEEFIIWLKTHLNSSKQIHADAFEQLTGEILTSHGFDIEFTGRIKNRSADLMAIQKNENGEEIKYLVECKRYCESNKVGIDILNSVVGASFRAKTSYAMLVTTSEFTSNVFEARAELEDFRLDLHDGRRVSE